MWSRPWRRRGKTAASRIMAGNLRPCGGQVIHSLPAAGLRGHLRSAMNNLGHGIRWSLPKILRFGKIQRKGRYIAAARASRLHVFLCVVILFLGGFPVAQAAPTNNILFIIADDYGADASSLFNSTNTGAHVAPTPNINQLGHSGVLFPYFYARPSCSAIARNLFHGPRVIPHRRGLRDHVHEHHAGAPADRIHFGKGFHDQRAAVSFGVVREMASGGHVGPEFMPAHDGRLDELRRLHGGRRYRVTRTGRRS